MPNNEDAKASPRRRKTQKRSRSRRRHNSPEEVPCDLFVPIPPPATTATATATADASRSVLVQQLAQRLASAGYQQIALTHTVFGKPRDPEDGADAVFPPELVQLALQCGNKAQTKFKVLRRLHAVIENLSDVAYYTNQFASALLHQYDLVSIAPQNDAVWRAVLESATAVDVITLDYFTARGLPFRLRAADVRTAVERHVVLEIPYAAAVLRLATRKAWIQAAADVTQASRGLQKQFAVLCSSSGERKADHAAEAGTLAIRLPRDVQNLATTVLGLNNGTAAVASRVLERARQRSFGTHCIQDIESTKETSGKEAEANSAQDGSESLPSVRNEKTERTDTDKNTSSRKKDSDADDDDYDDDGGDGFISF